MRIVNVIATHRPPVVITILFPQNTHYKLQYTNEYQTIVPYSIRFKFYLTNV